MALQIITNPNATCEPRIEEDALAYDSAAAAAARAELRRWPGYRPTPLVELPVLARSVGAARVYAKYEGSRTELRSFKALGGAYALSRALRAELLRCGASAEPGLGDLLDGRFREVTAKVRAVCASDGNHGRSVAWGAALFGCRCTVYLPSGVSSFREGAIRNLGADVVRVPGNYDEAVRAAAADAAARGWVVISDTATPTYREVPRQVTSGYSLMMEETYDSLPEDAHPTHVFVQVGCGGLAAVAAAYCRERFGPRRPKLVSVEPRNAACLFRSIEKGAAAVVSGTHDTVMGGLACGELSDIAWPTLRTSVDHGLIVDEEDALNAVALLHSGCLGSQLDCSESGAAGVAALLALVEDYPKRQQLELDGARVLVLITEGVTDPEQFAATLAAWKGPKPVSAGALS